MGFSIASAVFGGLIIMAYSIAIASYRDDYDNYSYYNDYGPTRDYYNDGYGRVRSTFDAGMALGVIVLILGIVEFAIGIWAAVCLCMMKPCTCCYGNPPQQVSYPRVTYQGFQLYKLCCLTKTHREQTKKQSLIVFYS